MIHARRVARAAAAAVVLGVACVDAAAQADLATEARIRLNADPDRRGPAALTWLRARVLPTLPAWPRDRDPFGAVSLRLSPGGLEVEAPTGGDLGEPYLTATIRLTGVGALRVRCGFDGLEVWEGTALQEPSGRLRDLLQLLGLERHSGPIVLDVAALVGGWLPGLDHDAPLSPLLSLGPAECGDVTLLVDRRDGNLTVVGRSQGGILLPAILWLLADLRARPDSNPRPITAADPWVLLARSARDAEREEAARQLVLCSDSIAEDTLERLLLADDFTRVVAMDALVRRRALDSLERVIDAATPAIGGTEELAQVALQSLLPRATRARRDRILESLPTHPSKRLRDFGARWRSSQERGRPAGRWAAVIALVASALGLVAWLGVRGVRRRVAF